METYSYWNKIQWNPSNKFTAITNHFRCRGVDAENAQYPRFLPQNNLPKRGTSQIQHGLQPTCSQRSGDSPNKNSLSGVQRLGAVQNKVAVGQVPRPDLDLKRNVVFTRFKLLQTPHHNRYNPDNRRIKRNTNRNSAKHNWSRFPSSAESASTQWCHSNFVETRSAIDSRNLATAGSFEPKAQNIRASNFQQPVL